MTHPINTNIFCDRLNQLYLRDQETTNFITTVRTLFGAPFVRRPGHKALQSTQPSSSGSGGGSSTRGRGGGGSEGSIRVIGIIICGCGCVVVIVVIVVVVAGHDEGELVSPTTPVFDAEI